jgi:hypothetical protein
MANTDIQVSGSKMTITVDLSKQFGRSTSGKNVIVATTGGNQPVNYNGEIVYVGVNVFKK